MSGQRTMVDPSRFALHTDLPGQLVIGRLVERGLHDELSGKAYAIIDGLDGQTHHLRFPDLDRTGDASPGAIVKLSAWTDRRGKEQASLLVRSDLSIESQVHSPGATWLDRQLLSLRPQTLADGFGSEVREALAERTSVLSEQGLAKRQGQRIVFARNLLDTLRDRELAEAGEALAKRHGLSPQPVNEGEHIVGTYRERVTLASGRFAMIDNGAGFQLVPWRQDLERHLGQSVAGKVNEHGGIDWSFARSRGPAI